MSTSDGKPTGAVYGFMLMLTRLITEHDPTHIGAVFDLKAPTFRHKMYDKYKAGRKPMPDELVLQVPILKNLLRAMDIKILEKEGYEADDIIGTLSKRFDYDTIIVSGDRDVLQLIDENTVVFNTKRGVTDIKVYNLETLKEEGFEPWQIIEYKALAGDSSDNIPGAPGVGEKTATGLLASYGGIDGVYLNLREIKGKLKERLEEARDLVYLSKKLATIDSAVPIECELDDLKFKGVFRPEFFDEINSLEFRSILKKFEKPEEKSDKKPEAATFGDTLETPETADVPPAAEVVNISALADLKELVKENPEKVAFSLEKTLNFTFDGNKEYSVILNESLLDAGLSPDEAFSAIKPLFEGSAVKILFDAKAAKHYLEAYGICLKEPYEDLSIKYYLADSAKVPKDLKEAADDSGAASPAAAAFWLDGALDKKLRKFGLERLYREIELPLVEVLYDMETAGFKIDLNILNELSEKYSAEIERLSASIYALADENST